MSVQQSPRSEENSYVAAASEDPIPSQQTDHPQTDMEGMRKQHLDDESLVRAIGTLYFLGGILALLAFACVCAVMLLQSTGHLPNKYDGHDASPESMVSVAFPYALIGITIIGVGYRLRKLENRARIEAAICAIPLGICAPPVFYGMTLGLLVISSSLFTLLSEKSKYVCSRDYHAVIQATPHIRLVLSTFIKAVLYFFLLLAVIYTLYLVFSPIFKKA